MAESKLDKLNLSSDEISKFGRAFEDETFRDLFRQYLDEISDPDKRTVFEEEITQLEKERGYDIVFVRPQPGYLIKTSSNGNIKTYINFCTSESIVKLSSIETEQNNVHGVNLSIPHSLSPLQTKYSKNKAMYNIYTVVFHPETLKYASENVAVRKLINDTAFGAVEKTFNIRLDKVNFVISKKPHKGSLEPTIIRQNKVPGISAGVVKETGNTCSNSNGTSDYIEPSFTVLYRDEVDLQNCTNGTFSKINALIPTHVIVEIKLPLLSSIKNTELDIDSSSIHLQNDEPVKYRLSIPLAYEINQDRSTAKFDPDSHTLRLELLVKRKSSSNTQSSDKLRSEQNSKLITEVSDKLNDLKVENFSTRNAQTNESYRTDCAKDTLSRDYFLRTDIKYKFPEYFCNYYQNKIAFVLKVKNVCFDSFKYRILDENKGCIVKFSTLGAGHFPMYYSFCVSFANNRLQDVEPLQYLIEEENIFVYLYLEKNQPPLEYFVGSDPDNSKKAYLNEPEAVPLEINDKKETPVDVNLQVTKFSAEEVTFEVKVQKKTQPQHTSTLEQKSNKLNGLKTSISGQEQKCDQSPDNINFSKFCAENTLEDEKLSLSESELIFEISHSSSSHKETNSDLENHSWIIESKSAKKAHRKKRAYEQKYDENGFQIHTTFKSKNEENDGVFSEGTQPIDIQSAYKYSDLSRGSILKKNRSFSESSGDELYHVESGRSFSVDDINFSSDSYGQSGSKKSVTFNDVISKKLYSSDISILEQRKRSKRRTQRKERRASESDTSENECTNSTKDRQENIRIYNENLLLENSETELTSVSESGETSDDQSDTQENIAKTQNIPCSKKNHKRRGKKSARKNASAAKHNLHGDY